MPKKDNHIHKYKRITYKSGHQIYRCTLVGCSHFINAQLIPGRFCICWRCGVVFVLKNISLVKPHCDQCVKQDKKKELVSGIDIDELTKLLI